MRAVESESGGQAAARAEAARQQVQEYKDLAAAEYSDSRRVLYGDVENLLYKGFLTSPVTLMGVNLTLRSLNPGDTFLVSNRMGRGFSYRNWQAWTLAQSVWMVEGTSVLGSPAAAERLYRMFSGLPSKILGEVYRVVRGLARRVSRALDKVEAYCYEPYSRMAWRMCGRQSPARDEFTGVPGTSQLGMNHVQQMWVAFNMTEDNRDEYLQAWAAAKLVASATSPKGIKRLNAEDDRLQEREQDRRRDVIRTVVHTVLYGKDYDPDAGTMVITVGDQTFEVDRVVTAKSKDQLVDQYQRWVEGEKDFHDLVVDTYKHRIRTRFEEEKQEREALLRREFEDPMQDEPQPLVGYTLDQLAEVRPDLMEQRPRATRIFDNDKSRHVLSRNVGRQEAAGAIQLGPDGPKAVPARPGRQGAPDTLAGRVAERSVQFRSEPMGDDDGSVG